MKHVAGWQNTFRNMCLGMLFILFLVKSGFILNVFSITLTLVVVAGAFFSSPFETVASFFAGAFFATCRIININVSRLHIIQYVQNCYCFASLVLTCIASPKALFTGFAYSVKSAAMKQSSPALQILYQ